MWVFCPLCAGSATERFALFALLFNAAYLPAYLVRKGNEITQKTFQDVPIRERLLLMAITWKCVVFSGLLLVDARFIWPLVAVVVLTGVEWVLDRASSVPGK